MKRLLKYILMIAVMVLTSNAWSQEPDCNIYFWGKLENVTTSSCNTEWPVKTEQEVKSLLDLYGTIGHNPDCGELHYSNEVQLLYEDNCEVNYEDIMFIEDDCSILMVSRMVTIKRDDPNVPIVVDDDRIKACTNSASEAQLSDSFIKFYLHAFGFHEPSCWDMENVTYSYVNSVCSPADDPCEKKFKRYFTVTSSCGDVINLEQTVYLDLTSGELSANVTQIPDINYYGCSVEDAPPGAKNLSDLERLGVILDTDCLAGNLKIEYKDAESSSSDGKTIVDRQYTITDECSSHSPLILNQKIILSSYLFADGQLGTNSYTDELPPPDEYLSMDYIKNSGVKIEYPCDESELSVSMIDEEPLIINGNERGALRTYEIRSTRTDVYPVRVKERWFKRGTPMEFKVEYFDCTNENSNDGQLIITPPEYDEYCPDCKPEESYIVRLSWRATADQPYEVLEYPDKDHPDPFNIDDLNGGEYLLEILVNCQMYDVLDKQVVYSDEFKIFEDDSEVWIVPDMSFVGFDAYCLMFGNHMAYNKYGVLERNLMRDKLSRWTYDWISIGEFMAYSDEQRPANSPEWMINERAAFYYSHGYEFMRDITMLKLPKGKKKVDVTLKATLEMQDKMVEKTYTRPAYFGFYNDSYDPNMITGPTGYGNDSIISTKDRIDYKISFENSPDFATAAASRVTINCLLHEKADPKTVRLGQFGFGDFIYEVPELSSHYNNRIDLADTLGVWLDVTAGLDIEKNEVYWIFQSIDPETGVQPNDTIGFLPVNDTLTGSGEGFVSFSITTFEDTKTGDTITERASIVFDENDVIPTNTCTNMFDAVAPTSVLCGDTTGVYSNYVLNFKALAYDDEGGSGIGNVELFVNADKTEYVSAGRMVKDSVSDTLRGSFNIGFFSLYQFVCLATDNVGNKEAFKDSPEFEFVNNNPPTDIFLSNRFFDEDVKIGTLIGKITTTDDQESNEFEYSLVEGDGDDDNSLFRIDDDKLKTNHDFRCGNVYSFRVRIQSKDVNGDSIQKAFYLYANETATPPVTVLNEKLCFGETYTFGGMELSEVGVYYDTLHTVYGCDSVVKLNLIHYPDPVITYYDQPNCEGEDFEYEEFVIPWDSIENNYISSWNRQNDTTLVFKIDVENADKCSDTLWLNMLLHPKKYDSHDITICENGLPFRYGDSIFSEGGQKLVHFTTVDGCDSIVTVNLTVEPTYYNVEKFDTICDNEEYVIFSDTITEPGLHFVVGKTAVHHCDSVVQLRLTVLPTYDKVFEKTVCPTILPMTYEGFDIPVDAVSGEMLRYEAAANGCDSIIHLNLTVRDAATQHNDIYNGWNWYSTYLDLTEIGGLQTLEDSLGNNGEQIKSQYDFVTNTDAGWMGSLTDIENEKMYMIKTNADLDLVAFSCTTEGSEHPITMANGWNWIGYVSRYTMPLETAMAGLDVTPQEGDIIKSYDHGFAAYYADFGGWFGSLTQMQPGAGYMYKSNASNDITLTYPTVTGDMGQRLSMLPTHWNVKNRQFPETMTFIGKITVDNLPATIEEYEVGVFCDNEVRGSGRAILMEGLGTYRLFIQVYGRQGDELTFRLYDHRHGREADATSTQVAYFIPNADYGRITDPYVFKFYTSGNGVDDIEGMSHELTLVPNPAEATDRVLLFCDFTPEERNGLTVEVFNTLGVRVQQTEPTRFPVQLKEITYPGSYTVKVTTGTGRVLVKKLVVTR